MEASIAVLPGQKPSNGAHNGPQQRNKGRKRSCESPPQAAVQHQLIGIL